MRFWLAFLLIPGMIHVPLAFSAGDYVIEFQRAEESTSSPPFSITRVAPSGVGLRLFLNTDHPDAVAGLLAAGALQAQISDHQSETATAVSLSFGKAVWCSENGEPIYLGYLDPLPSCGRKPPARIEYFFEAAVVLGPGSDLAIGQDPDFLWLIEER